MASWDSAGPHPESRRQTRACSRQPMGPQLAPAWFARAGGTRAREARTHRRSEPGLSSSLPPFARRGHYDEDPTGILTQIRGRRPSPYGSRKPSSSAALPGCPHLPASQRQLRELPLSPVLGPELRESELELPRGLVRTAPQRQDYRSATRRHACSRTAAIRPPAPVSDQEASETGRLPGSPATALPAHLGRSCGRSLMPLTPT